MSKNSKAMRAAVKNTLVPFLYARGFQDDTRELLKPDSFAHLMKRFMRWKEQKLELVEIQFDKRGRAMFTINFGIAPPEGVDTWQHIKQLDAGVVHLRIKARLYSGKPWLLQWFGFPMIRIPIVRNPSAEDIVQRVIRIFPQVEAWLRDGVVGPNIGVDTGFSEKQLCEIKKRVAAYQETQKNEAGVHPRD